MGFWIMILSLVIGIALIVMAFKRDFSNTKNVLLLKSIINSLRCHISSICSFFGYSFWGGDYYGINLANVVC